MENKKCVQTIEGREWVMAIVYNDSGWVEG